MSKMLNKLISIVGTTGVGKSQLSIELAKAVNGEIINADSMQIYSGVDMITNKHPVEERHGIPHHLLGHVQWDEEYYVHRFQQEALEVIRDIHARGKIPILIGGTHYYIESLLFTNKTIGSAAVDSDEETDRSRPASRKSPSNSPPRSPPREFSPHQQQILNSGPREVFRYLHKVDPAVAQKFHPNNDRRIRRALEVYFRTGRKPSDIYREQRQSQLQNSLRFDPLILWVFCEQQVLDPRLDSRVDNMIRHGLFNEIQQLDTYFHTHKPAPELDSGIFQVIGYRQFIPWLKTVPPGASIPKAATTAVGDPSSVLQECIEKMKSDTRKYARKQTKWIRNKLVKDLEVSRDSPNQRMFVLDATDLTKWEENVFERGLAVTKAFVKGDPISVPPTPAGREELLFAARKSVDPTDPANWVHKVCDICTNRDGSPYVCVGGESWENHIAGRRHKRTAQGIAKRLAYEEWKRKNGTPTKETERETHIETGEQ